ncbi:uncharacterized protein [Amphiura filiformis]|uniref:uncharacterized protein n=1 Tax=Amphiura filiformis TaxID=82378 RepID=UPI003B21944A
MDDSTALTKHLQVALKEKNLQVGTTTAEITKLSEEVNCIILHKVTPTIDIISTSCYQAIDLLQQHSSYGGVITCIVSGVELNKTWHQVQRLAQQITTDIKLLQVYFVIIADQDIHIKEDSARLIKASNMVASLVYSRNQHLNGQVFVV